MKTAKEFMFYKYPHLKDSIKFDKNPIVDFTLDDLCESFLVEFARIHVEAALKEAVNNVKIVEDRYNHGEFYVSDNSILNAYPLTNIK